MSAVVSNMSFNYKPLKPATVEFTDAGIPFSGQFNDIYYAGDSPLQQAHQVFLQGNQLPQRWQSKDSFTILETGFGLGHNFVASWHAWRSDPKRSRRLHFASIEAHPFRQRDVARLLDRLAEPQRALGQQLVQAWPPLVPGIHRLEFDNGAVTLTLALGPVDRMVRQLDLGFDACFLDGFAPRVNPDMWMPEVFKQLARMARKGATLASWCSAGQVRRDLQNAGFLIERCAGFGAKRHRITGVLRPNMGQSATTAVSRSIAVIGSGFAGASAAYALVSRGHDVTVVDPALAAGAAGTHVGHHAAALTPSLSRDDDIRSRLSRAGVLLAALRWGSFDGPAQPWHCGSFQPVAAPEVRGWQQALQRLKFPEDWMRWVDSPTASRLTGMRLASEGIWHAQGYMLDPPALLAKLLESPAIRRHVSTVDSISQLGSGQWLLRDTNGHELACTDYVVMATGGLTARLLGTVHGLAMPRRLRGLHTLAGQISYFRHADSPVPQSMLAADGLCFPGSAQGLIGGSTYVSGTTLSIITDRGHHEIRKKVAALLEISPSQLGQARTMADGWSGWRATVHDRLPVIGPVAGASGLWLACGFGSRGLTWSALAAELLAARLNHEPIPLARELSQKIAPG